MVALKAEGYHVKFIEFKKVIMLSATVFAIIMLALFGQSVSISKVKMTDVKWLKVFFCQAIPFAQTHIKPDAGIDISLTRLIFGFDISKPHTIISNQIAVVYGAGKAKEEQEATEIIPVPSATATADAIKIEEITISPQSGANNMSAEGINIRNHTSHSVDAQKLINEKLSFSIKNDAPQVLIVHTHSSEAFTPYGRDYYVPTDPDRTEDENFNIMKVGAVMAKTLNDMGINTLHDKTLHDYPSYNGSYKNCLATVQRYLKEHPSIKVVLDIHRDAIATSDGKKLKVCTTIDDKKTAQVMIVCGTNGSGLEHPSWKENLKLAMRFQAKMNQLYPNLARPLSLVNERYNMHASKGALLIEVGSNGNTLEEAINGGTLCAISIANVLEELK